MRTSQSVSICPILEQAINAIDESFDREKKLLELKEKFFKKESERRLALPEGTAPKAQLECPSREQYIQDVLGPPPTNEAALTKYRIRGEVLMQHPPITRPNIENAYLWRHQAVHAVNWLVQCGWTTEAQAIADVLDGLPKQADPVDWQQPGALDEQLGAIREGAKRVREILQSCLGQMQFQGSLVKVFPTDGLYADQKCFVWGGERFERLTKKMIKILDIFEEQYRKGFPVVSLDLIKDQSGYPIDGSFIDQAFKVKRKGEPPIHPVADLIRMESRGSYRLIHPNLIKK